MTVNGLRTQSFSRFFSARGRTRFIGSTKSFFNASAPISTRISLFYVTRKSGLERLPPTRLRLPTRNGQGIGGPFQHESRRFLTSLSSRWPLLTFNSGFFAFEQPLYEEDELIATIQSPEMKRTCLERKASPVDQPAFNWLVLRKQRKIFNFNLPLQSMESTMVDDYYDPCDVDAIVAGPSAPAFLHYAGPSFENGHCLIQLFTSYLTVEERREWDAAMERKRANVRWLRTWPLPVRALNYLVRLVDSRFYVQPKF